MGDTRLYLQAFEAILRRAHMMDRVVDLPDDSASLEYHHSFANWLATDIFKEPLDPSDITMGIAGLDTD